MSAAPPAHARPVIAAQDDAIDWRDELLHTILKVAALLGLLVYGFSVYKAWQEALWTIIVVDTLALVAVYVLWLWRGIGFRVRSLALCAVLYGLGAMLLTQAAGVGQLFLLGQSMIATVLLGLRVGLGTVALNSLTPLAVGLAGVGGWIIEPAGWRGTPGDWLLITLNFLLISLMLVIIVGGVLGRLERALHREIESGQALARERGLLHARERHLQTLIDATPDAVLVLDQQGRMLDLNRAGQAMLECGADASSWRGQPWLSFVATDDQPRFEAAHAAACRGEARTLSGELVGLRGQRCLVEMASAPLPAQGAGDREPRHLALLRDITVRHQLEEQLREPQRLAALGKLTGGMAHDFNNLLTVVLGHADDLSERLRAQPELQAQAEMIAQAAQRGADLIRSLLAFAGRQPLSPQATDLGRLLTDMQALLQRTLGEQVVLELRLPPHASLALVDPTQMEAAVLNLCINARDAMPDGGRIDLALERVRIDPRDMQAMPDLLPGDYWRLSVTDNGQGMSEAVRAKAVEPFFTTKGVGKGTGLGLSMVYGFVRQSRGLLRIDSAEGVGTCVTLYLPAAPQDVGIQPHGFTAPALDG